MLTTQLVAMTEGAGGLFDFNSTLPLIAIQFVLLMVILTVMFYGPTSKILEAREIYIASQLIHAYSVEDSVYEWYEALGKDLQIAQVKAQATVAEAKKEA